MVNILLDTSIIVEKSRNKGGLFDSLIELSEKGMVQLYVSAVVLAELWTGESMNYPKSVRAMEKILRPMVVLAVDGAVAKLAGELVRLKVVAGFDAIIAATALDYKMTLATLNKKHFEGVKGLRLYT